MKILLLNSLAIMRSTNQFACYNYAINKTKTFFVYLLPRFIRIEEPLNVFPQVHLKLLLKPCWNQKKIFFKSRKKDCFLVKHKMKKKIIAKLS